MDKARAMYAWRSWPNRPRLALLEMCALSRDKSRVLGKDTLCRVRDKGLLVKTSSSSKNFLRSLCRGQLSAKLLPRISRPLVLGKACESISVRLSSYMICLHSRCSHLFVRIIFYLASYIRYFFHRNYRYKHSYGYIHLKLVPELDIYSKSYKAYLNITLRMLTRDQACRS